MESVDLGEFVLLCDGRVSWDGIEGVMVTMSKYVSYSRRRDVGFHVSLKECGRRVTKDPEKSWRWQLWSTGAKWDYSNGPKGPAPLGRVVATLAAYCNGDMDDTHSEKDGTARFTTTRADASIYSDGKVKWAGGIYNCHDWDNVLDKLVFHAPSEHTYYGEREGKTNEWLEQVTSSLSLVKENLGRTISLGMVDSAGFEGEDLDWSRYYRYLGSLTAPPYSESPWVICSLLKAHLNFEGAD